MKRSLMILGSLSMLFHCFLISQPAEADEPYLAPRNTEVPFPYLQEGTRHWPSATGNGNQIRRKGGRHGPRRG